MDEYLHDPILWGEIISSLPVKVKSTLNQHKAKIIGHLPDRDLCISTAFLLEFKPKISCVGTNICLLSLYFILKGSCDDFNPKSKLQQLEHYGTWS